MKEFKGRVVAPGTVSAPALVSHGGLNTLASFQKALQFGDKEVKPCGVCDICLAQRASGVRPADIDKAIMDRLRDSELDVKDVAYSIGGDHAAVVARIDKMLHEGKISMTVGGKLKIIE